MRQLVWGEASLGSFQIRDEQKVDYVTRVIGLINGDSATARGSSNILWMVDGNCSPVSEVHHEGLKWLSVVKVSKFRDGHWRSLGIRGRKLRSQATLMGDSIRR
jgi:hypothetical protein